MSEAARTWRRRVALAAGLALVAGAVGLALLCSGGLVDGVSPEEFQAQLDALQERGEPMEFADLDLDGDAGAEGRVALRAAWDWMDGDDGPHETTWPRLAGFSLAAFLRLPAEEQAERRAFSESIAPFVDRLREAVATGRIQLDPAPAPTEQLPDGEHSSQITRALLIARHIRITAWDAEDPAADLDLLRLQAEFCEAIVPTSLQGELRTTRGYSDVLLAVRDALQLGRVTPAQLREAVAPALAVDADALVRHSLRLARVRWLTIARRASGDAEGPLPSTYPAMPETVWAQRSVRAGAIAWSRDVDEALAVPEGDLLAMARRMRPWHERSNPYWIATFDQGQALREFARILPPIVCRGALRLQAIQHLCLTALALVEHHAETGRWPTSLDDLTGPGVSTHVDPFTGEPLAYRRTEQGIVLTSTGPVDAAVWGRRALAPDDASLQDLVWEVRR